jgi:hypothetical protein
VGTGLGLSIVRDTITSLGGKAWADFRDDGTSFFFTMPNRRAEDDTASAAQDASIAPVTVSLPGTVSAAATASDPPPIG